MAQLDATAQNGKIGQELAKQSDAPTTIVPENETKYVSKNACQLVEGAA